jgi:cellulose synthase operon protein C
VLRHQGRLEQAIAHFDSEAQRQPGDVASRLIAAVAVHTRGDVQDAERRYKEVLKIEPRAVLAANNLASLYLERGENLHDAEQLAIAAVEQAPGEAEVLDTLGSILMRRSLHGRAIKLFEQAVSLEPNNARLQYNLGTAYAKGTDPVRAREALREAVRLNPRFADARDALQALDR